MGKVLLAHLAAAERDALLARIELVKRGPNTLTSRAALLAELRRVRESGIAVNDAELAFGLRSIAVPVRDRSGEVVAAINLAVHRSWVSLDDLVKRFAPPLRATAATISARAGYRPDAEAAAT
jgi:IclR family pca regulon transcriptional regulator